MVRLNQARQMAARSPWAMSASASPPEHCVSVTTPGKHGAIGEKLNKRSSSESSGYSTEELNCPVSLNRLSVSPQGQDMAGEQASDKPVTPELLPNGQVLQAQSVPETAGSLAANLDSSSHFVMPQTTSEQFPQQRWPFAGQGGTASSLPDLDLHNVLSVSMFSPSQFIAGFNQEMERKGLPGFPSDFMNVSTVSDRGFPAASTSNVRERSNSAGAGLLNPSNSSGQFLPSLSGDLQGSRNSGGVASVPAPTARNNYSSHANNPTSGNFPAFSSQHLSQPSPAHTLPAMAESVQKKVTCNLCNKNYKWPHNLECCHVYCFPCITSRFDPTDKSIVCPKCNHKTTLPNGPCSLKLDNQVARFMRQVQINPFNCTGCTRENEAVMCCTTCIGYLCSSCTDVHKNMNQFQNHTLCPITKVGKTADGDYTPFCAKHPSEPLRDYCQTCELLVCSFCMPDHLHPEHPSSLNGCVSVYDIYPIIVDMLKKWIEDAQIKARDLTDMSSKMPLDKQHMEDMRRRYKNLLDEFHAYCKNVIDQSRQSGYELVDKAIDQMEMDSQAWKKNAEQVTKKLIEVSDFTSRTVNVCKSEETIEAFPLMKSSYQTSVKHYDSLMDNGRIRIDLKFDPDYKACHEILNQNFLAITYSINGVEHKVEPSIVTQVDDTSAGQHSVAFPVSKNENSDCNYQHWTPTPDIVPISTWSTVNPVTKISYLSVFGEFGQGEYSFSEPSGQAYLKDGSFIICDTNHHRIMYYNANHEYVRTIGQSPNIPLLIGQDFPRQDGYLFFPNRVAVCPVTQNIVAIERPPSHAIQIFTVAGEFVRSFGRDILQHPRSVCIDEEGTIILTESHVKKLVLFSQDGRLIVSHLLSRYLVFPMDVAVRDKKIFICDNLEHCVFVFNYNGELLYRISNEQVIHPIGVSINHLKQVVITNNHNSFSITLFDMSGTFLHRFESVTKVSKCHSVAIHPNKLELMLSTKDCSIYFFNYDPDNPHIPVPPFGYRSRNRHPRGNSNGHFTGSSLP